MIQTDQTVQVYPTWEELIESGVEVKPAPELNRLKENWIVTRSWKDGIFVKDDLTSLGPVSPYYNKDTNTLHPIATAPISEPKVSSVSVISAELDGGYADLFQQQHGEHIEGWEDPKTLDPSLFQVEIPPGWNFHDENRDPLYYFKILRCCREPRPEDSKVTVVVKASPSLGYVTIHDYIMTVHPWLLSLEDRLLPDYRKLRYPRNKFGPTQFDDLCVICALVTVCCVDHRPVLRQRIHDGVGYGQKDGDMVYIEAEERRRAQATRASKPYVPPHMEQA